MISNTALDEIKKFPIYERIEIIENLLESLKSDIASDNDNRAATYIPFVVHKISLGQEIHVDRDDVYSERGM